MYVGILWLLGFKWWKHWICWGHSRSYSTPIWCISRFWKYVCAFLSFELRETHRLHTWGQTAPRIVEATPRLGNEGTAACRFAPTPTRPPPHIYATVPNSLYSRGLPAMTLMVVVHSKFSKGATAKANISQQALLSNGHSIDLLCRSTVTYLVDVPTDSTLVQCGRQLLERSLGQHRRLHRSTLERQR